MDYDDVESHDPERDPVHTRDCCELDQRGIVRLCVSQSGPWEPQIALRSEVLDRGPQKGRGPNRPRPEPSDQSVQQQREDAEERRQQQHREKHPRDRDPGDPVQRAEMERHAGYKAHQKSPARPSILNQEEQRHETHICQKPCPERRKGQCQHRARKDREQQFLNGKSSLACLARHAVSC